MIIIYNYIITMVHFNGEYRGRGGLDNFPKFIFLCVQFQNVDLSYTQNFMSFCTLNYKLWPIFIHELKERILIFYLCSSKISNFKMWTIFIDIMSSKIQTYFSGMQFMHIIIRVKKCFIINFLCMEFPNVDIFSA